MYNLPSAHFHRDNGAICFGMLVIMKVFPFAPSLHEKQGLAGLSEDNHHMNVKQAEIKDLLCCPASWWRCPVWYPATVTGVVVSLVFHVVGLLWTL